MTMTELKRQLRSCRWIAAELAQLTQEMEEIRSRITSPKSQNMDGMPHAHGAHGDPLADAVGKLIALEERYCKQVTALQESLTAAEDLIQILEPQDRFLMRCRYVDGMSWETISEVMKYSLRHTHRMHGFALKKILDHVNHGTQCHD